MDDKPIRDEYTIVAGGKLDAATRAKLIAELDTMDDHALFVNLVSSYFRLKY